MWSCRKSRSIRLLALLGLVIPLACRADERKQLAFETIDRNAAEMAAISDAIFYFGEPGMQEFESTKLLKGKLEAAGFRVELGGAGMPTNVWAEWGTGHPKIAIVTEIDALPSGSQKPLAFAHTPLVAGAPGHMEGHNTHGGVASVAAFAVKQAMQRYSIPGTVAISFGPAEEQIASRPFIVRAGYFKDVDAVIYLHIRDSLATGYGVQNLESKRTPYLSLLPADAKPPVDLNRSEMEKFRPQMRRFYLDRTPRFN